MQYVYLIGAVGMLCASAFQGLATFLWTLAIIISLTITLICGGMTYLSMAFSGWNGRGVKKGWVITALFLALTVVVLYHPIWFRHLADGVGFGRFLPDTSVLSNG